MSFVFKLPIYATPGAKQTQVAGAHLHGLRVRLAAPPVDGKANIALLQWAASTFDVTKKQVQLLHGANSRQKMLQITFSTQVQLDVAHTLLHNLMHPNISTAQKD